MRLKKSRKYSKPTVNVPPENSDESDDDEELMCLPMCQLDPVQNLNNPVAQLVSMQDNVPEPPGELGIVENGHPEAPLLRRLTWEK